MRYYGSRDPDSVESKGGISSPVDPVSVSPVDVTPDIGVSSVPVQISVPVPIMTPPSVSEGVSTGGSIGASSGSGADATPARSISN